MMLFNIDQKNVSALAAIDDAGGQLTYGELVGFAKTISGILPKRELVFCLCENSVGSLAGFVALYDNRDVCLLINADIDRELLDNLRRIYHPSCLWIPECKTVDFGAEILFRFKGYVLCRTEDKAPALHPELSLLMTTSGSTGSPKLVRHKYGNVESNARNVANAFGWTSDERGIVDLPMQYTMGLNVICSHLYEGATVLLVKANLTQTKFWQFIKEEKGTNFTGVPFSYEILSRLRFWKMDLLHLNTLAEGGGKLSDSLFKTFADYAIENRKRFFATFGTTETTARLAFLPPEEATTHIGSIGRAIPEGKIYLADANGKEIKGVDVEGELVYEGPNVTMGYALSVEDLTIGDEFCGTYHTGDIAKRDGDGCYYIVGRMKRFLKFFGLRVSLDQCERIITEHFGIDCACTGDDSKMRIYITKEDHNDAVKMLISEKTGLISTLFEVRCVEAIPRLDSGKINYKQLG